MRRLALVALLGTFTLSGCLPFTQGFCLRSCSSHDESSSTLVSFLYPSGQLPPPDNSIPRLSLPLRVGLAFLPANGSAVALDEAHRNDLLEQIRRRFADRPFISHIEIIPDYYLAGRRGFEGLQGVQHLYNLDLIALVSYDQVTDRDLNKRSLAYLTILGAYVFRGNEHDISTLVDLAIVDPATHSLVLRAGGTDERHGTSTAIDETQNVRSADIASLNAATTQMIGKFDQALTQFQADVRAGKAQVQVSNRNGSAVAGGGGAIEFGSLAVLLGIVVARAAILVRRARAATDCCAKPMLSTGSAADRSLDKESQR